MTEVHQFMLISTFEKYEADKIQVQLNERHKTQYQHIRHFKLSASPIYILCTTSLKAIREHQVPQEQDSQLENPGSIPRLTQLSV